MVSEKKINEMDKPFKIIDQENKKVEIASIRKKGTSLLVQILER